MNARDSRERRAQTVVDRWNTYRSTLGYIPALLDGSVTAATVPMVEGLVYPAAMGLTNAIDRTGGPYAAMLQALSNHLAAVLVPGRCLNAASGAWLSTSATPTISWQSKNFICQYVAQAILGIENNTVDATVDQIHASLQIQDGPLQGFCDALNGTGVFQYAGGPHYPRGITTALWWLNAGIPSVSPNISAALSPSGIVVSWPSAYVGWILQTNSVGLSNAAGWGDVPDSITSSQMSFPTGVAPEFFRLRHP